jgi:hypothetical protein
MHKVILVSFFIGVAINSLGQNFPGGVTPLQPRLMVLDKIAVVGDRHKQLTEDVLMAATAITIDGITFQKIWLCFNSDKLTMMILSIPSDSDKTTIVKILTKKYKKATCTNDNETCFQNGNIKISISKDNSLIYQYNKEESF